MSPRCHTLIIGAGIMGLGIAWRLARLGVTNLIVLERGYLSAGASGRNGGGLRQQWSTEDNIELMLENMRLFKEMTRELGVNVWLRQGGYLFLLDRPEEVEAFTKSAALQNRHGLPTRVLSPREAQTLVPGLRTEGILAAAWNPSDAVIFPWSVLWGYAEALRGYGIPILERTTVTGLEQSGERITTVVTDRGDFQADFVVNAAGAWGAEIARLAGVECPNQAVRHEILATEPLKPWLDPMVVHFGSGLYFSQSMRGELIAGITVPGHRPGEYTSASSWEFVALISRSLLRFLPQLGTLRILRQWAGPYDLTPDNKPILGPVPGGENFIQVHGFAGHGFMMAPVICKLVAEWLVEGRTHPVFEQYRLERFKAGGAPREAFIIG